jgi:hypothetical protein
MTSLSPLACMALSQPQDHVVAFTEELLRTGLMLIDVMSGMIEGLPAEDCPGEEPAAVVLEMVTGTINTAIAATDEADVMRATRLLVAARERVVEHLRLALELSRELGVPRDSGPATDDDGAAGRRD